MATSPAFAQLPVFRQPPPGAGVSPEIALPCAQAGGFRCVSCPYRTLLSSAQQAYDHVRICLAKLKPQLTGPSLGNWEVLFVWLRAELEIAEVEWLSYDQELSAGMSGYPALPVVRPDELLDGYVCKSCRSQFSHRNTAVKHCKQHTPLADLEESKLQRLGDKRTVVLEQVSSLSQRRLHDYARFDCAFARALLAPPGAAAAAPPAPPFPSGPLIALPLEATYGSSQITSAGADRRPDYLIQLGWLRNFRDSDAEAVLKLTAPVPSAKNKRSADESLEANVLDMVTNCCRDTVATSAQAASQAYRVLLTHSFKYGDDARVKEFQHCTAETQAAYSAEVGKLVLFVMRYCDLPDVKMLHQWRPNAKLGLVGFLSQLKLLAADPDDSLSTDDKKRKFHLLVCDILLCLFSESSTTDPRSGPEPPVHAALKASSRASLLVTFVCCSIVVRGDLPNKFAYADAQRCRKLCGPLIYFVKALVLHRLGSRPNLPAPDLPFVDVLQEPLISPGDPEGSALLELVRDPGLPFKVLVSIATTSRYFADRDATQLKSFEPLPDPYHGYFFNNKIVFSDLLHEAGLRSLQELDQSLAGLGIYSDPAAAAAVSGGVPLPALYEGAISFTDSHKYQKECISFLGSSSQLHDTVYLANRLNYQNQNAPIQGLVGKLSLLLRRFLVAIYADTKQGARVTEYLYLQAVATGGLRRHVSIDALGCIQLYVTSKKNNLSDVVTLSPELSKRGILILALVRPFTSDLLKEGLAENELDSLLPGVNADTGRRDITRLYSAVNLECGQLRTLRGLQPLVLAHQQDITPSVLRQFVHMLISSAGPAEYAAVPSRLKQIIDHQAPSLLEDLASPAFRLMQYTSILPKLLGQLALHTPQTASKIYGQSRHVLPLEQQQTGALREFVRDIVRIKHNNARSELGSPPSSTNKSTFVVQTRDAPMIAETPLRTTPPSKLASATVLEESPAKRSRLLDGVGGGGDAGGVGLGAGLGVVGAGATAALDVGAAGIGADFGVGAGAAVAMDDSPSGDNSSLAGSSAPPLLLLLQPPAPLLSCTTTVVAPLPNLSAASTLSMTSTTLSGSVAVGHTRARSRCVLCMLPRRVSTFLP